MSSEVQRSVKRETLSRRTKTETFTWAIVERIHHKVKVLQRERREVKLFREILTEQTVSVLIKPPLAGTSGIGKELFCTELLLHGLIVKEFIAIVDREGPKQRGREGCEGLALCLREDFCLPVWQKAGNQESGTAVHKSSQSAFATGPLHGIAFPMPEL